MLFRCLHGFSFAFRDGVPPDVWEHPPRAGLLSVLGDCPCRVQAVLEKKSFFVMSSSVERAFQHCLGSTRGKEAHSNYDWLKSRHHIIIICLSHFRHLPRQAVSPAANPSTTARRMLSTSQYQPSFVQPFVCIICWGIR